MFFTLKMALGFLSEAAIGRVQLVNYCEVVEGGLSEIRQKILILDVDGLGAAHTTLIELRYLKDVSGVFCIFLCSSSQMGVVFCIHPVFLKDKITHKQMQNLHYAQIIP